MASRQDFILNENGWFPLQDTVVNGVWVDTPYGDSDEQHKLDIIVYSKGSLKQTPDLGFNVQRFDNAEIALQDIFQELQEEMKKDGYLTSVGVVGLKDKGFYIDCGYISANY
jgi:tRNA G10  N-methylase Trm11